MAVRRPDCKRPVKGGGTGVSPVSFGVSPKCFFTGGQLTEMFWRNAKTDKRDACSTQLLVFVEAGIALFAGVEPASRQSCSFASLWLAHFLPRENLADDFFDGNFLDVDVVDGQFVQ